MIAARMEKNRETPWISECNDIRLARIVADVERVERPYLCFGGACLLYLSTQMRVQDCHGNQPPGSHMTTCSTDEKSTKGMLPGIAFLRDLPEDNRRCADQVTRNIWPPYRHWWVVSARSAQCLGVCQTARPCACDVAFVSYL